MIQVSFKGSILVTFTLCLCRTVLTNAESNNFSKEKSNPSDTSKVRFQAFPSLDIESIRKTIDKFNKSILPIADKTDINSIVESIRKRRNKPYTKQRISLPPIKLNYTLNNYDWKGKPYNGSKDLSSPQPPSSIVYSNLVNVSGKEDLNNLSGSPPKRLDLSIKGPGAQSDLGNGTNSESSLLGSESSSAIYSPQDAQSLSNNKNSSFSDINASNKNLLSTSQLDPKSDPNNDLNDGSPSQEESNSKKSLSSESYITQLMSNTQNQSSEILDNEPVKLVERTKLLKPSSVKVLSGTKTFILPRELTTKRHDSLSTSSNLQQPLLMPSSHRQFAEMIHKLKEIGNVRQHNTFNNSDISVNLTKAKKDTSGMYESKQELSKELDKGEQNLSKIYIDKKLSPNPLQLTTWLSEISKTPLNNNVPNLMKTTQEAPEFASKEMNSKHLSENSNNMQQNNMSTSRNTPFKSPTINYDALFDSYGFLSKAPEISTSLNKTHKGKENVERSMQNAPENDYSSLLKQRKQQTTEDSLRSIPSSFNNKIENLNVPSANMVNHNWLDSINNAQEPSENNFETQGYGVYQIPTLLEHNQDKNYYPNSEVGRPYIVNGRYNVNPQPLTGYIQTPPGQTFLQAAIPQESQVFQSTAINSPLSQGGLTYEIRPKINADFQQQSSTPFNEAQTDTLEDGVKAFYARRNGQAIHRPLNQGKPYLPFQPLMTNGDLPSDKVNPSYVSWSHQNQNSFVPAASHANNYFTQNSNFQNVLFPSQTGPITNHTFTMPNNIVDYSLIRPQHIPKPKDTWNINYKNLQRLPYYGYATPPILNLNDQKLKPHQEIMPPMVTKHYLSPSDNLPNQITQTPQQDSYSYGISKKPQFPIKGDVTYLVKVLSKRS